MPVTRYRSIEEMPRPWRALDDPENLRFVARLMAFHRTLSGNVPRRPGVRRFRSYDEAESGGADPAAR